MAMAQIASAMLLTKVDHCQILLIIPDVIFFVCFNRQSDKFVDWKFLSTP
jgi:hypothetical protein